MVESAFGHVKTAALLLFLAAGSAIVAGVVGEDGVGLSGVGYGLFGLLWVLSRRDERFAGAVDSQTIVLFVAWFFLCILTTWTGVWNVGNIAHGAGAGLGILIGFAVADQSRRRLFAGAAGAIVVVALIAGTFWRPYLNTFDPRGQDFARLADQALAAGRLDQAARLYELAVTLDPDQGNYWYNLGVTYGRMHRGPDAEVAFERAYRCRPGDSSYRKALVDWKRYLAYESEKRGDDKEAARRYQEAVELDDTDAASWHNLGCARLRLGDRDLAARAFRRATELAPDDEAYRTADAELKGGDR